MQKETFYERFEKLLKVKKIQKKEISERCGISKNGISTWKTTGTIPRADIAIKIAKVLNISVEFLINGDIEESQNDDSNLLYRVNMLSDANKTLIKALLDAIDTLPI